VAALLALDHFHILVMEKVATVIAGLCLGDFAIFSPEIALADVVVIGDGDAGAIPKYLAEGEAKLEPCGSVFFVIVGLIAREEQDVGILVVDVAHILWAQTAILIGVAGEGRENDLIVGCGVLANQSFKTRCFTMKQAVFCVCGIVPIFDAKGGGPA
jgi:hypothetical protein